MKIYGTVVVVQILEKMSRYRVPWKYTDKQSSVRVLSFSGLCNFHDYRFIGCEPESEPHTTLASGSYAPPLSGGVNNRQSVFNCC